MNCHRCGYPIRTRWWMTFDLISADAHYSVTVCSLCWSFFMPTESARRLNTLMREHPVQTPMNLPPPTIGGSRM